MTYVIAGSCIKDDACLDVCPADCIHPRRDAPDFDAVEQLYIDPSACVLCDACVEACPIEAIYAPGRVPQRWEHAADLNRLFFAER